MSNSEKYISYFRPEIDSMQGYAPGEQPKVDNLIKINTNESPYPPAPGVQKILQDFSADRLRLYPDPVATAVREEIASMFGARTENVIAGNGSDDILNIAIRCFCDARRPVAVFEPGYSLYPTLAALQGAECLRLPLDDDFSLPKDALNMAAWANLLIITRPNAPTGNIFPKDQVEKICRDFKGIVLIDEAYADFAADSCMEFAMKYSNAIVARTFSKSRCLAGLRFGYAVAHKDIIAGMMKMKDSYNVSMLTQLLALASLKDREYFEDCISKIRTERERVRSELRLLGFKVIRSETNFLFACPPDRDGEGFFRYLRENAVLVRYFPGPATGEFVRITIGTPEQMNRLLELAAQRFAGACS